MSWILSGDLPILLSSFIIILLLPLMYFVWDSVSDLVCGSRSGKVRMVHKKGKIINFHDLEELPAELEVSPAAWTPFM
jgi:hypothetical protein